MLTATKIRLYPNAAQADKLAKAFSCGRWYWNNSLAETQKVYQETGKGMMKNQNLAKAIGDAGWGSFTTMLKYKTANAGKGYIEVNRFFASSKTCSCCLQTKAQMPLGIRTWTCDQCGTRHDRDINAAFNIRNQAQRMITAGIVVTANGGAVSQAKGRKSSALLAPLKLEAPSFTAA